MRRSLISATTSATAPYCFKNSRCALCDTAGTLTCEARHMKRCPTCQQVLPLASFSKAVKRRSGGSYCKNCQSEYNKEYYKRNRRIQIHRSRMNITRYRQRNRESVAKYLSRNPCVDCGEGDLRVLEFDHVRGRKDGNVSALVRTGAPLERILSEIAKCDVRCANCHRRKTVEQLGWSRRIGA